jgi:hypothetical protein
MLDIDCLNMRSLLRILVHFLIFQNIWILTLHGVGVFKVKVLGQSYQNHMGIC